MMMEKIKMSTKPILYRLIRKIERNVLSLTGNNLREIMIFSGKNNISDIDIDSISEVEYFPVDVTDTWKNEVIDLLLDAREDGDLDQDDEELLEYLCTQ